MNRFARTVIAALVCGSLWACATSESFTGESGGGSSTDSGSGGAGGAQGATSTSGSATGTTSSATSTTGATSGATTSGTTSSTTGSTTSSTTASSSSGGGCDLFTCLQMCLMNGAIGQCVGGVCECTPLDLDGGLPDGF